MEKFSLKSLLTIIVILLIGIVAIWQIQRGARPATAGWFNDAWQYRKAISLGYTGTSTTNVQVKLLTDYDLSSFVSDGKLQADLDDIRFTDINGNLLSYWIEDNTTSSVDIWALIPNIDKNNTIYFYYGNSMASSLSNSNWMVDIGGTISTYNNYRIHAFKGDGTYTNYYEREVDVLVIAGGGGGGSNVNAGTATGAGGGGAGGLIYEENYKISDNINITIGNGGSSPSTTHNSGDNGENSIFDELTAIGGGGGGNRHNNPNNGGSGGGVGYHSTSGGIGTSGQGNNGGSSNSSVFGGAGGGGADEEGVFSTDNSGTNGGNGLYFGDKFSDNLGENGWFAGGGGGGGRDGYSFGVGGSGGGGNGGINADGSSALNNTGGGGGGSGDNLWKGGDGGSGIVLVRYLTNVNTLENISIDMSASEEISPAPIAYWSFDEGVGTTVYDSTSNQNNGVILGTTMPTWQTVDNCVSGKCIFFPGGTYNTNYINTNKSVSVSNIFTISHWVKTTDFGGYTVYNTGSASGYRFGLISGKVGFLIGNSNGHTETSCGTKTINDNKWHMITGIYNNETNKFTCYIDGSLESSVTVVDFTDYLTSSPKIGGYAFNGFIDEVKIYAYARTAAQIKQDYRAGLSGMKTQKGSSVAMGGSSAGKSLSDGLMGYWKMDENTGTIVGDSSGVGNTGTFATGDATPSWSSGKYGVGVSFDGVNDYINFGNPNLSSLSNATISFWRKAINTNRWLLFQGQTNGHYIMATGGSTGFYHANIGSATKVYVDGVESNLPLTDSNWHHYVITNVNLSTWTTLQLSNYTTFQYNGSLDEVRLYNRNLSKDEVRQLYEYTPGPLFHWDFNEKTGTTAFDKNGNTNLPITNATHTTGKIDGALQFNGDGWLSSSITPTISAGRNYSQCLWFYPTTSGVQNLLIDDNNRWEHWIAYKSNQTVSGCFYNSGQVCAVSSSKAKINKWNHVCFTVENGVAQKIYLNGILEGTNTETEILSKIYDDVVIGASGADHQDKFTGKIDEVKIYNYVLSQKQVIKDMNASAPVGGMSKVNKPIAWYKFDEGYGTVANNSGSIGSTINGTLRGTTIPTWSNDGKINKALTFNGASSYVSKSDNNILDLRTGGYTATAWIKGSTQTGTHKIIIEKGGSSLADPGFWWSVKTDGKMDLGLTDGNNWLANFVGGSKVVTDNLWHHVAFVWNPSIGASVFVDGKIDINVGVTSAADINSTDSFRIGGWSSTGYSFNGLIDEVKIYNYALSADEIKQDYNQGSSAVIGKSSQTIGATTTSLDYCIPGDTSHCAAPIAEYNFEEGVGTTAYDSSGNNLSGIFEGSPTWTLGKIGKGISFNGTSSVVKVLDNTIIKPNTITAELWFNTSDKTKTGQRMLSKTEGSGYQLSLNENSACPSSTLCFLFNNGGTYYSATYASSNLQNNTWYHMAGSYDGTTGKLFLNGIQVGTTATVAGTINQGAYNMCIGSETHGVNCSSGFYQGKIDNVRIYNYARTPAQIAYDYNKGAPIGHWKMDECQGTTINDSSGNNNHGTLNIGVGGSQSSVGTCQSSGAWYNGKDGKINSAMSFDGNDDYINAGSPTNLDVTSEISLGGWIKVSKLNVNNTIVTRGYILPYKLSIDGNNKISWSIRNTDSTYSSDTSNTALSINKWYHVFLTFNDVTHEYRFYLNGVLDGSGTFPKTMIKSFTTLLIGAYGNGTSDLFNGLIDDVRIYNYALTAEQVKQVYNGGAMNFR